MAALSTSQRRALEAICDTFVPGSAARGAPDRMLAVVETNPRDAERAQVVRLLLSLFALGRFAGRPQKRREAVLRGWCDSRVPQRRAAFQALRKGALHMDTTALYDAIGYPGALGAPEREPERPIVPLEVGADTTLDCDVCVIGGGDRGPERRAARRRVPRRVDGRELHDLVQNA